MRKLVPALLLIASSTALSAESLILDRRTAAAPGVPEKVFKDAGYNVTTEYNGKPALHVVLTHLEPNSKNGELWIWNAVYLANYVCPLANGKILSLGAQIQTSVETMTNPTIPKGIEMTAAVHKKAATDLAAQLKSGALDEDKQHCSWLQSRLR